MDLSGPRSGASAASGKRAAAGLRFYAAAALIGVVSLCGCRTPPLQARPPTTPDFRVMTYNLNYWRSGREETVRAILEADCDIVCLQEVDEAWARTIQALLEPEYREVRLRVGGIGGGKAVLSRYPLREIEVVEATLKGWHNAWLLEADTPAGPVQILHVHLTPPLTVQEVPTPEALAESPQVRLDEMRAFYAHVDTGRPHIVLGDFNETADGGAVRWLEGEGLTNVLPLYDSRATWSWLFVSRTIDHILHSPHLESVNATVLEAGESDHRPVVAHLQANVARLRPIPPGSRSAPVPRGRGWRASP